MKKKFCQRLISATGIPLGVQRWLLNFLFIVVYNSLVHYVLPGDFKEDSNLQHLTVLWKLIRRQDFVETICIVKPKKGAVPVPLRNLWNLICILYSEKGKWEKGCTGASDHLMVVAVHVHVRECEVGFKLPFSLNMGLWFNFNPRTTIHCFSYPTASFPLMTGLYFFIVIIPIHP